MRTVTTLWTIIYLWKSCFPFHYSLSATEFSICKMGLQSGSDTSWLYFHLSFSYTSSCHTGTIFLSSLWDAKKCTLWPSRFGFFNFLKRFVVYLGVHCILILYTALHPYLIYMAKDCYFIAGGREDALSNLLLGWHLILFIF